MMIMLMQGGMVSAITAVQASRPAVSFGSCLVLRTAGMMMPPTAAMSASLEPETPEKKAVAVMVIRPSPPRTRPNMRSSSSISRDDMPLDSISKPASTKNGMASSTKWSMPAMTCCEYTSMGSDGSAMKKSSDDSASTKAIGTPSTSPPKKPRVSSTQGLMAWPGSRVFQSVTAATSPTPTASVSQTVRRGPLSALAAPNMVMNRLPITTG